jgi:hypothetical protein
VARLTSSIAVAVIALALAVLGPGALAAAPKHGATYTGKNHDGVFSYPIRFTVSKTGKHVAKIKYAVFVQCISPPVDIPFATARNIAIHKGSFTLRINDDQRAKHRTVGSLTTLVLTGHFHAHGKASGSITEHDTFEQGKGVKPIRCSGSTTWTAKA